MEIKSKLFGNKVISSAYLEYGGFAGDENYVDVLISFLNKNYDNNGYLEILKYAHENGCPWDENTCCRAAENGYLDCLKYVHENGCPWNEGTCHLAARYGHLECLKYAHENGCPWN